MNLKIVIPAYKRPEFLQRTLDHVVPALSRSDVSVLVIDDGTPDDSLRNVTATAGVRYLSVEHDGIMPAIAAGIEAVEPSDNDCVFLLGADHELPLNWPDAILAGAEWGLVDGEEETGQIDHIPGLRLTREWRAKADFVDAGVSIRNGLTEWQHTCSLPSLISPSAALGFASYIREGGVDSDPRQPFAAQNTYQAYFAGRLKAQSYFYLIGDSVKIDHFGHNRGLRPGWIKNADHEAYYREIGRR